MLLPDLAHRGTRRLQRVWALFVAPVVVVIAIVALGGPHPRSANATLFVSIAALVALIDFGSMFWIRSVGTEAVLAADSNAEIREAYGRRMLLACSFAAIPTLLAFTFVIVAGTSTTFFIIAAASLGMLAFAGPRRGDIDMLDDRMVEAGRPFRVAAALDS